MKLKKAGKNLSCLTMRIMTALYGYASLEAAENKLKYGKAAKEIAARYFQGLGWNRLS